MSDKATIDEIRQAARSFEVKPLYTAANLEEIDFDDRRDLGLPGQYPFTRGIHPSMYRGRLWTMRQYAGFGSARETNRRFRHMLERGMEGINVAFDLPTQHGYDSDDPRARGEVGKVGIPVNSLRDLDTLFDGIPLDRVSPANAINAPAAVVLAMYVVLAARRGIAPATLTGSTQNDILKEFIARGTYIFPPLPSIRLVIDVIEYCTRHLPRWNFINVCGYHIREAGGTLVHEVGFALADAITYVEAALARGLAADEFLPRFAFNFTAGTDVFAEAAKFRAMRRLWARIVRERFGARAPASWAFRTGAGSAASELTAQQPENNIVRITLHALAAALGGVQSIHTPAYDEALALPTERSVTLALRTQQVLACESGIADVIDPLAGSYYVEMLTHRIEEGALTLLAEVERRGGMVAAIESGWVQGQIADAAWQHQREVESGDRPVVGINRYVEHERTTAEIHRPHDEAADQAIAGLARLRAERDGRAVARALDDLRTAAEGAANLVPVLVAAVEAHATTGEICGVLREAFGEYRAAPIY
jgi:methylmalonyl-CoA mutase N-terminal domain/subunit